jgi:hypothetical protein
MPLSDLLDGQGKISLSYQEAVGIDLTYVEHGSVVLDSAKLIVEGVIPEPATALLFTLGGLFFRKRK